MDENFVGLVLAAMGVLLAAVAFLFHGMPDRLTVAGRIGGVLVFAVGLLVLVISTTRAQAPAAANRAGGQEVSTTTEPSTTTTTTTSTTTPTTLPETTATLAPASEYLADMDPLTSQVYLETGAATVNGEDYVRSVILRTHSGLPTNSVEYNLSRKWRELHATVGLRDDSPTVNSVRIEAFGDGRQLYAKEFRLGESEEVKLDVSNVLRLELVVNFIHAERTGITRWSGVWGDARLVS